MGTTRHGQALRDERTGEGLPLAYPARAFFRAESVIPGVLALVLGLITLDRKSWWFDEAYNIDAAGNTWPKYVGKTALYEPSQSLYLVLFKAWRTVTPESEWFTRFPSVLAAALAAALLGVLGARLFGRAVGLVAGILLATNVTFVTWSQQARTYTLAVLASIVVTMVFLRAAGTTSRNRWLAYGLVGVLGAYAHFFVGFVIASHATLLPLLSSAARKRFFQAWLIIAIGFLPAVPFIALGKDRTSWIPPVSLHELRDVVAEVAGFNVLVLALALAGVAALLLGAATARSRWKGWLLLAWAGLPLVAALVVSIAKPLLVGRYLIVSAPALALLGAAAVGWLLAIRTTRRWLTLTAAGVVTLLLVAVSGREIVSWYRDGPYEDWRAAARYAVGRAAGGSPVVLHPEGAYVAYQLYAPLPSACRFIPGHYQPRCDFRATGNETIVVTTEPDLRGLPGAQSYDVAAVRTFEGVRVVRLVRKDA
jgi:uncharacterized membrane protein